MAGDPLWPVAAMSEQDRIRETYRSYETSRRDRIWDARNPGFARLSRDRDVAIRDLLARSLPAVGGTMLDVGCGDGTLLGDVRRRWPDVALTGLDLQPERIDEARVRVPDATFTVGSADALPFEDASFDVVTAITLVSSLPTDRMETDAAREIARVTRPGGWLIWFDLRYDNPNNPAVHGITTQRLSMLFAGWSQEIRSSTLIPPIARRLGPSTPVLYPILEAIPLLRSHLIGRLRCPT
jgi:ubiquinone/menaquinone biosynthesis C-methylase UbiE